MKEIKVILNGKKLLSVQKKLLEMRFGDNIEYNVVDTPEEGWTRQEIEYASEEDASLGEVIVLISPPPYLTARLAFQMGRTFREGVEVTLCDSDLHLIHREEGEWTFAW